ncbi:hypothetical protein [Pseudoduganella danionis]|uniref:hypothetical protein n=1 Tax=Pseudoduganella danionis TaxID=1890295 RepID=UPI0035AFB504
MKPYQILMLLALAGSAALLMFGDSSSDSGIAEAVQRPRMAPATVATPQVVAPLPEPASSATPARNGKAHAEATILHLIPRAVLVGEADEARFGVGEGIFRAHSWNPPAPAPAQAAVPNLPPMAPPLPFAVIGKALADGVWEVYLARGDKTYVARPQTIIDGSYRVEKIAPPSMSITYLPLNQLQQMNIGALD